MQRMRIFFKRLRPVPVGTALLACTFALGGCEWITGSDGEGIYRLRSVAGEPLPANTNPWEGSLVEVTEGSLHLRDDGTFTERSAIRCMSPLPPGTECHVNGDGRFTNRGTYDRERGTVHFDGAPEPVTARFEGGTVTLVFRARGYQPIEYVYRQ